MKNKFKNFFARLSVELNKHRFIRKTRANIAAGLCLFIFAEMLLTGMGNSHKITIYVDGETIEASACGITVGELFSAEGIILGADDEINISLDEVIHHNMNIIIDRVVYLETETVSPIKFDTVYEESTLYEIGTEFVSSEGENGTVTTTYREKLVNGEVVTREVTGTTTVNPVDKVITIGTAKNIPVSKRIGNFRLENGVPTDYAYIVSGKVTAYTAPEGAGTYSGRTLGVGTVAVNPDIIPFGSELYICSKDGTHVYGYAIAADTGDLTEVVADVFMGVTSEHYGDACRWGAQFCDVYVLTVGDNSVSWM